MERSGLQRIIPIILIIVVIALAIWALVSVGRVIFSGDGSSETAPTNNGKTALTQATADRSVRMSVRGPIVAGENFRSYTISVSPDSRNMTTYTGYTGEQIDTVPLSNNMQAYTQFVSALSRANMMEGLPLTGEANNTDGICATGNVYVFEVLQATNVVQSLWTSTCKGSPGSLKASLPQLQNLFQSQIPTFSQLARKVNLS